MIELPRQLPSSSATAAAIVGDCCWALAKSKQAWWLPVKSFNSELHDEGAERQHVELTGERPKRRGVRVYRAVIGDLRLPDVGGAGRRVPQVADGLRALGGRAHHDRVRAAARERRGVPQPICKQ